MTDVVFWPTRMVTDPVLILTVTPEGPEMVVMSVCAETEVDSMLPKPSVTALSRPLVTVPSEAEEPELPDALSDAAEEATATPDVAEEPPSRVILPPPRTEITLPDAAEEALAEEPSSRVTLPPPRTEITLLDAAEETLLFGAGDMVADGAGEAEDPATGPVGDAFAAVDEASLRADERLESAEESTEASGGLRKSLPSDVGAGSPFDPAKGPVGSPREMSD